MAEIALASVSKRFGDVTAVEQLSLTVGDGEFVVLLGPTGAGKTTTLRLIAGLEQPDEGRISIGGQDMTNAPPHARDMAFVFQQYSLYPHYSVFDNLAFPLRSPLRAWSEPDIKAKVTAVAKQLRIEAKLANRATQLSGGEMQRVAIGRALVRDPAAYLMDEPLSSLDAKLREDLRVELKRIQVDLGTTLVYVTHDQIEAMTLADRIGVLDQGRLIQVAGPREIYERPDTLYVARRLGSPQINLLPPGALGLTAAPDGTATLGLRPEALVLGAGDTRARIKAIEHLGADTVVQLDCAGETLSAFAPPGGRPAVGEEVALAWDPAAVLYFDAQGLRIGPGGVSQGGSDAA